jgi:hypothetical protein
LETFAESIGLSSADEAQREWERVQGIPKEEWEQRHAAKQKIGIALPQPREAGEPWSEPKILGVVAASVKERLEEGDGNWVTCTGCHESEDGYDNGYYPHSNTFGCKLGGGCSECGGIGAIWDTTDYGAMADEMHAAETAAPPPIPEAPVGRELADALRPFIDGLSGTEAAKMIDRRYRGLNPIQVVVTKFQYQAAHRALKPQDGGNTVANEDISTNPAPRLHAFKPQDGGK